MFDFFIETGKGLKADLQPEDLFHSVKYCNKKACYVKNIKEQDIQVSILGKNKNFPEIMQDDEFLILIFGYCFTRFGDNNSKIMRLQAKDIPAIYKKHGKDIVKQIKGSYAVIIYNFRIGSLDIFTDELNLRTVHYAQTEDKLFISNSVSSFVNYSRTNFSTINTKAILEYALFDFVLTDETFIKNVHTIPPAAQLKYFDNQVKISRYWDIFNVFKNSKPELPKAAAYKEINQLLKKNLDAYLSEPEKTAFALTGGYDSRTNLALLNGKHASGYYYSYGVKGSYDIKFAQKVARKLKLNFHPFILDNRFADNFPENALTAINIGDGMVEMSRANYIYAFKNLATDFDYILTGLFGSELIKRPTSLGGYIDKNIHALLFSDNIDETYQGIIEKALDNGCINKELLKVYEKDILNDLKSNPYINNKYSDAKKYFFYMVGWGMRKYFMKEIKAERLFVENLHPYMDIEFIELLLKTPFPWIYNWGRKKNLLDNLKIHKFYAQLMQMNNKKLTNIPTTHAYKPKYLLNKMYLPLLIAQYAFLRRKIKKAGIFNNTELMRKFYAQRKNDLDEYNILFHNDKITADFPRGIKEFNKLISLQIWMKENKLHLA
jgi:asparagine synthetase B (glutamine-hydrolysing)